MVTHLLMHFRQPAAFHGERPDHPRHALLCDHRTLIMNGRQSFPQLPARRMGSDKIKEDISILDPRNQFLNAIHGNSRLFAQGVRKCPNPPALD